MPAGEVAGHVDLGHAGESGPGGVVLTIPDPFLGLDTASNVATTKQGEEVIITERGKPIALIQPITSVEHPVSLEARLAKLAAEGFVTLPTHKPLRRVRLAKVSGPLISKTILEDRR